MPRRSCSIPPTARYGYPYINCTDCGPRYSIVLRLPYDRAATTMEPWPLDRPARSEYHDPAEPPVPRPAGRVPGMRPGLSAARHGAATSSRRGGRSLAPPQLLRAGAIVAIKGLGGYHLACDARNAGAVAGAARPEVPEGEAVRADGAGSRGGALAGRALARRRVAARRARPRRSCSRRRGATCPHVAPGQRRARRHAAVHAAASSAVRRGRARRAGDDQRQPLERADRLRGRGRARAAGRHGRRLPVGERPIARRVEDSVVRGRAARSGDSPPRAAATRRARSAPLPVDRPVLALGADLKNAITLVVDGQAFVSQHIGDLDHYERAAARSSETIHDLLAMYDVRPATSCWWCTTRIPQYRSTAHCAGRSAPPSGVPSSTTVPTWPRCWPSEAPGASACSASASTAPATATTARSGAASCSSAASRDGFERVAHLRPAALAGGDAAARHPVQAAAGFLAQLDEPAGPDERAVRLSRRATQSSRRLLESGTRVFTTTSAGRLFDAAAALLGFTRPIPSRARPPCGWSSCRPAAAGGRAYPLSVRRRRARLAAAARGRGDGPARGRAIRRDRAGVPRRARARDSRDAVGGALPRARARHRRGVGRRLPERAAARRARDACSSRLAAHALDQSRASRQRRRRQPGTGRARRRWDHARALDRAEPGGPGRRRRPDGWAAGVCAVHLRVGRARGGRDARRCSRPTRWRARTRRWRGRGW